MAAKTKISIFLLLVYFSNVQSASSFLDHPLDYVMSLGRNVAPSFTALLDCFEAKDVWGCAKSVAGKMLDVWDDDVEKQRQIWRETADAEVRQSGRQLEEAPSKLAEDIEASLFTISDVLQHSIARSFTPKKHGGIDTITVSTKPDKKKKKKHVHVVERMEEKGPQIESFKVSEEIEKHESRAERVSRSLKGELVEERGFLQDAWTLGEKSVDSIAEHVMKSEDVDNGIVDKSSVDEQRGKKKKKKKAILKLLLLGAVLKAKIGTMLQILSFKLQVKFLLIAIAGLLINLARFWIDVKKQGHQPPQKVIYYEHAQHQHHYDHEEEPGWSGGGAWSRSIDQEEGEPETDMPIHSPYRGQENVPLFIRPVSTRGV